MPAPFLGVGFYRGRMATLGRPDGQSRTGERFGRGINFFHSPVENF
jgi:hypothetical protein